MKSGFCLAISRGIEIKLNLLLIESKSLGVFFNVGVWIDFGLLINFQ